MVMGVSLPPHRLTDAVRAGALRVGARGVRFACSGRGFYAFQFRRGVSMLPLWQCAIPAAAEDCA